MIHSYDPGNGGIPGDASGLYWTVPVNPATITYPATNTAVMTIQNFVTLDHFVINTIAGCLGTLNCTVTWSGNLRNIGHKGTTDGYKFDFTGVQSNCSIAMTVSSQISTTNWAPFTFQPSNLTTKYAEFGNEDNGIYATR
jgi:hypothetical protein